MPDSNGLLLACGVIVLLAIPLVLQQVPPNRFYGFRTPRTLSDPDIWYRANVFSGWSLLLAACVSALLLTFAPAGLADEPPFAIAAFVLPLLCALVAGFVYLRRL